MALSKISLHDGKHKLIVAEEGERVLTPEQNKEYETSHPNARQTPMTAQVYDKGGAVRPGPTHLADASLNAAQEMVQLPGNTNQMETYDKGGKVLGVIGGTNEPDEAYDKGGKVTSTPLGSVIADRAQEIYEQGKALRAPEDNEASSFRNQQANVDAYKAATSPADGSSTTMRPYAPAAVDKIHPTAAYGSRPGEKRIDTRDMTKPLGSLPMYDEGGKVQTEDEKAMQAAEEARRAEGMRKLGSDTHNQMSPAYKVPEGAIPTYDDGGTVTKDNDDPEKAAAYRQAEDEVMNNAPLNHGDINQREAAQDIAMHRYPEPQKPARLQYDTENPVDESKGVADSKFVDMSTENAPLGPPVMNKDNGQQAFDEPMISEASAKTPLGPKVAPQGTGMKQLPGGPISDDVKQAVGQSDMGPDVSKTPPTPQEIINMDKMDAMKSGDLVKLGMAHINERALQSGGVLPTPTPTAPTAQENLINQRKELKDKMINGATEQIRFQAEKDLAELNRRSPLGSEGNHPGFVGKLGHVLGRVGQAALAGTAPYLLPAIPGSQAQLAQQEARGEQGVEQAQKKEQQAAVTKEAEQQPALREEAQKLAAQKNENTLRAAGYKTDPTTGERVPLTYEEMSPQQQAVADKNESIQTLNEAKGHEQEAKAILEKYKADPNNAQNQAALQKLQLEGKKIAISAGNLGIHEKEFLRDTYGVDEKGEPIPGVQTTPEGKPVGTKISAASAKGAGKVTANQSMKADLAENVVHNVDEATKLIRENPGLFGKVSGRFTTAAQMIGSNDPAIAKLGLIIHNTALATNGIHGLRSAQAIEGTEKELLNKFKNSPEATIAALKENRRSVEDFMKDGGKKLVPDPDLIPAGASHEVLDKAGNVTGHVVNNKYVALPKE